METLIQDGFMTGCEYPKLIFVIIIKAVWRWLDKKGVAQYLKLATIPKLKNNVKLKLMYCNYAFWLVSNDKYPLLYKPLTLWVKEIVSRLAYFRRANAQLIIEKHYLILSEENQTLL